MVRVVIAGGPYSGKTSIINKLAEQGIKTVPEASLKVFLESKTKRDHTPWKNRVNFQKQIMEIQVKDFHEYDGNVTAFDRGLPDGIAYFHLDGIEPSKELLDAAKELRYDHVLILDLLPDFISEVTRWETTEEREKVHALIYRTYKECGYSPVKVPFLPTVEERVAFVTSEIEKLTLKQ